MHLMVDFMVMVVNFSLTIDGDDTLDGDLMVTLEWWT